MQLFPVFYKNLFFVFIVDDNLFQELLFYLSTVTVKKLFIYSLKNLNNEVKKLGLMHLKEIDPIGV